MSIIKLQNEGETLTMHVAGCEVAEGQFGEQVKFTADTGDVLYLPKTSADNQLDRLNLTYPGCIGNRLTFSRDKNKKAGAKPYWGINIAGPATAPSKRIAPPSGAPPQGVSRASLPFDEPTRGEVGMSGPPDAPLVGEEDEPNPYAEHPPLTPREVAANEARSQRERDYLACWDRVAIHLAYTCHEHRIPLDASAVQATTFSIFGGAR